MQAHPPFLEVNKFTLLRSDNSFWMTIDFDFGFDFIIGHRQQLDAGLPPRAQDAGDLGQRLALGEQLGADDVRGEVEVAEGEPGGACAVGFEFPAHGKRLARAAPALLLVAAAAERVHHRIEVRAYPQAEQGDVVGGVANDGDGGVGGRRKQAAQEARAADASGQDGDPHEESMTRGGRPAAVGPNPGPPRSCTFR